jgi:hypothetical protein
MTTETPRRRGRPPKNDPGGGTTHASFHLGLRLNGLRRDQLLRLVEAANERAKAAGVPATVTASSLVTMWIVERIEAETARLSKKR